MRRILVFTLLFSLFMIQSCDDANESGVSLSSNLITEINAFDLDNNSDASDIRVDFTVSNNQGVSEYRIMLIPSSAQSQFDREAAIASNNYEMVEAVLLQEEYSINRLSSSLLDANGNSIQEEIEYVAMILIVGISDQQLSNASLPFTLKDQGSYSGEYTVVMGNDWNLANGAASVAVITDSAGIYKGELFGERSSASCTEADTDEYWGYVTFKVNSSNQVTDFFWEINTYCILPECSNVNNVDLSCVHCSLGWIGNGVIEDEIIINMNNIRFEEDPSTGAEPCYHGWEDGMVFIRS